MSEYTFFPGNFQQEHPSFMNVLYYIEYHRNQQVVSFNFPFYLIKSHILVPYLKKNTRLAQYRLHIHPIATQSQHTSMFFNGIFSMKTTGIGAVV
jgi:hypothetical protein